jgi:hypothetical protein
MMIDAREWGTGVGGVRHLAPITLTLSAMARSSFRDDTFLQHLCRALVLALAEAPHGREGLGWRSEGGSGNGAGSGEVGAERVAAASLAQALHALATLDYRHEEAIRAVTRAVMERGEGFSEGGVEGVGGSGATESSWCEQSMANIAWCVVE